MNPVASRAVDGVGGMLLGGLMRAPGPVIRRLAQAPPRYRGTPLELRCHWLTWLTQGRSSPEAHTTARSAFERLAPAAMARPPARVDRTDGTMPCSDGQSLTVAIYRPRSQPRPAPCVLYLHGGGWTIGSVHSFDSVYRHVAHTMGCTVLAVDYRLAPEHPFPTPLQDAWEAYLWMRQHTADLDLDPQRLCVGGDSAGANLATAICIRCEREGVPQPALQMLIYPAVDLVEERPSWQEMAGQILSADRMRWFIGHYAPGRDQRTDPLASPLLADFSALAPALVATAGFDVLRDEGEAYAGKLHDAGGKVEYVCFDDMPHGFVTFGHASPISHRRSVEVYRRAAIMLRD